MRNIVRELVVWVLTIFMHISLHGQNPALTSDVFDGNKSVRNPMLSPNGNYASYCLEDATSSSMELFIKATNSPWNRKFTFKSRYYFPDLRNDQMVFQIAKDSVVLVQLGKSGVRFFSNVENFKVSPYDENIIALSSADILTVWKNNVSNRYFNVNEYFFAQGGQQLLAIRSLTKGVDICQSLCVINLKDMVLRPICTVSQILSSALNYDSTKIALLVNESKESPHPIILVCDLVTNKIIRVSDITGSGYFFKDILGFTRNGKRLIVRVESAAHNLQGLNTQVVKVWDYQDDNLNIESEDVNDSIFLASASTENGVVTQVGQAFDNWEENGPVNEWDTACIVSQTDGSCYFGEQYWNAACKKKWYLVELSTGRRTELKKLRYKSNLNTYYFSPDRKFIVYYNNETQTYFSYDVLTDTEVQLPLGYSEGKITNRLAADSNEIPIPPRGVAGWAKDKSFVFIYDMFDVWRCDLHGKKAPQNITNGYGAGNEISFSFLKENIANISMDDEDNILVSFNHRTKDNGFYKLSKLGKNPIKLFSGPYLFYLPHYSNRVNGMMPVKAMESNTYIVRRESSTTSPNYFFTRDFIHFKTISEYLPEYRVKRYSTHLHSWSLPDGRLIQGVLFKPTDFDSTRKYPVIFQVYEGQSNMLNAYVSPDYLCSGCEINPAVMINQGYLIFKPDIIYKFNQVGESALISVESAVNYLKDFTWFDTARLGIQGCSFGGFETNYIITHSKYFKAACTAAGVSDIMSWASDRYIGVYTTFGYNQFRISSKVWDGAYTFNDYSPIYKVKDISCPVLIFHTTVDGAVPFKQGLQLFLTLRRLGKPSWLLQYGGSADHGVFDKSQKIDFSRRMLSFFDYYLLGGSSKDWMVK